MNTKKDQKLPRFVVEYYDPNKGWTSKIIRASTSTEAKHKVKGTNKSAYKVSENYI